MKKIINKKNMYRLLILIISGLLAYNISKVIYYYFANHKTGKMVEQISKKVTESTIEDNDLTEIIEDNYYSKTFPLIDVNYESLKEINEDTIGWLKIAGTKINYPILKSKDNTYYLNHSFDKKNNPDGWIFLDTRNNSITPDMNNLIYGHSIPTTALLGELPGLLRDIDSKDNYTIISTSKWLSNKDNYLIYYNTDSFYSLWEVFSIYSTKNPISYFNIGYTTTEFNDFINKIKNESNYNFDTEVNENSKVLTISSCYYENPFTVINMAIHAKLIKIQSK